MAAPKFQEQIDVDAGTSTEAGGILPGQAILRLIDKGEIRCAEAVVPGQVQPASLDLRLGATAFRIRASFLPGPRASVAQILDRLSMHRIDLTQGAVLERDCVYIVLDGVVGEGFPTQLNAMIGHQTRM